MTDFKEYLRVQKEASEATLRDKQALNTGAVEAWSQLKKSVHDLAAGESYDGEPFQWSPYPAPYPEFLLVKNKNVAVSFHDRGVREGIPQNCMIRFGRRPLSPNNIWSDDEALPQETWHLNPIGQAGKVAWSIAELKKSFSTSELANEILIQFIKYYEKYSAAFREKYGEFLGHHLK
jgi:hypothetical protein